MKLNELKELVNTYREGCVDSYANSKNLRFFPGRNIAEFTEGAPTALGTLNQWASRQVALRFDAPAEGWLWDKERCPEDLSAKILNELVSIRPATDLLIRTKSNDVRGVLSKQYTRFDNHEMVDLVTKAVDTMGIEPDIVRVVANDTLSAYVLFKNVNTGTDPRDKSGGQLHPAIHISNNEVGGGTARITGAVFSGFCSNGCIYGWKAGDVMSVRHRFSSEKVMGALVADAIAIGLEMSEEAGRKFVRAQEVHIPVPNLAGIVANWARTYGISVDTKDNWLQAVSAELVQNERQTDPTLFDVVNGLTWISKGYEPAEQILMERMAGDLLATVR